MNFDTAFQNLIGHEGGYVNHPEDPGGETKYGISKRSYPNEDIKNLTLDRAKEIYRRDFWAASGCDALPECAKFQVFDTAVNSGIDRAIKLVQKTVGVKQDGVLGAVTLQAIQAMNASRFVAHFAAHRLEFMVNLPNWQTFSKGWARRIASNLLES
jgi:lysozyme family protein